MFTYLSLLLVFVVVKFDGLSERIASINENRNLGIYNYNIVPFRTLSSYFRSIAKSNAYTNILGNIISFIPLGFLTPIVLKRHRTFVRNILICFISIVGIEAFQLITKVGYFDIDDILLNTIGYFIGYCIFHCYCYLKNGRRTRKEVLGK